MVLADSCCITYHIYLFSPIVFNIITIKFHQGLIEPYRQVSLLPIIMQQERLNAVLIILLSQQHEFLLESFHSAPSE